MNAVQNEIEKLSAALKHFEQAIVARFRSDPAEAEEIAKVAESTIGDHPLVKDAINLAREKAQQSPEDTITPAPPAQE